MNIKELSITKIPFALRGNIHVMKSDGSRIIAGYANVAIVDSEDQFIPVETLKKGIECLLNDPCYSNLMLVHQNIQIGKIIDKYGEHTTHVDDKGLFIVAEIRKDLKIADEIWQAILNNDINGFSIGCEVINSHKKCDDIKCVTILDEINIFEVSVCTKPVNEESGFIIISKSKAGYVCDECVLDKENMSEIKVVPEVKNQEEAKKPEEITQKTPDPIAELANRITELEKLILEAKKPIEDKPIEEPIPCNEAKPPVEEPITPPPVEKPIEPPVAPEENKPPQWSAEEEMAIFMLDYIVNNPKSKAQDIVKAWIESKRKTQEPVKAEVPKPVDNSYPYPEKMGEVVDKLSAIVEKLTKLSAEDELKLAIKSRDDQIIALQTQIKTIPSTDRKLEEGKPKTLQDPKTSKLDEEGPIQVEHGNVYFNE
jgi:HK97 family phage prohead protease